MKAIVVDTPGAIENMRLAEIDRPTAGPNQALVRVATAGVNFIDTYHRGGLYPIPERPFGLGVEGAGIVEAIGEGVDGFAPGDRVAWAMDRGSYAEFAVVSAARLVPVPQEVPLATAAQAMLQGMTAHYLTRSTFALHPGQTCLVHAAAGGTGTLIVQMAKLAGAKVIGTVSTRQKAKQAEAAGCDHVINYKKEKFAPKVRELTDGRGVDVVYDGVGKATFEGSLEALRPRGTLALFGQSSGSVKKFDPQLLNQRGSLFLTRPSLGHYIQTREELLQRTAEIFGWLRSNELRLFFDRTFPLADAPDAHQTLESRKSNGKLTLTIDDSLT